MAIDQTLAAAKKNDDESKSRLDALLAYANGITGQEDANIGDAVKTLCDGYGHGSGGAIFELVEGIGNVVTNAYISNGVEIAYTGWNISKYYPAVYMDKLLANYAFQTVYCAVYDESFNYVGNPLNEDGFYFIRIANAAYIRFSGNTSIVNSIKVVRYKEE